MPGMESHVALNPGTWPLSMHLAPLFELHSSLTGWFLGSVQKGKTDQGGFRKGKDQADKRVKSGMGGELLCVTTEGPAGAGLAMTGD